MSESERLQRWRFNPSVDNQVEDDKKLEQKILNLLNHSDLDEYCLLDAYYYDYSEIPMEIMYKYAFCGDVYLIYGITNKGELVSKWVERYNLDCDEFVEKEKK